jgi:adenosylhomocysteine nucleosidase
MLLRWIVNNYLREAAEGKVRGVVSDLKQSAIEKMTGSADRALSRPEPRSASPEPSPSDPRLPTSDSRPPTPDHEFLPCDVAFIYALGIESGGLVDLLQGAETSRHPHGAEHAGKLAGREVAVIEGGVGQKAAVRATAEAIKFYQPKWVISAGFGGGLNDGLRRGHIVMADEVANLAGQRLAVGLQLDPASLAAMKGLHVGRLLTVDSILRQPAERRRLAEQHGAIACDMESFAVAETCRQHGIPLLAIRVISDAVDDELPPEIEHLLAQKSLAGKLGAAAGAVLKRFSVAKDLWKLREDALKASDRLAKFLVGVVAQLPNDK